MDRCARCGTESDDTPGAHTEGYCESCSQTFAKLREQGVWVRYPTDVAGGTLPPGYYVRSEVYGDRYAHSRVDALATATEMMDQQQLDGVFDHPATDTHWLISEYLAAHPDVADDVAAERDSFLSRLSHW